MAATEQLLLQLERAFGAGAEREIAQSLFRFLDSHSGTSHITLQLVRQLTQNAGSGRFDGEILRTLQFLAGDTIALLETRFEIFDEDERPHEISKQDVKEAIEHHTNPLTGDSDPDVATKIFVFFAPKAQALSERSD